MTMSGKSAWPIRAHKGFTMIEILVVVSLIAIVASFALYVSTSTFRGFSIRSERDTIVSALQKARSQAMSNICLGTPSSCTDGLPHGVHFNANQYVIYQGATYNSSDPNNQAIPVNNPIVQHGNPADILFNQLDGSSNGGTITLTLAGQPSEQIIVNSEGQIDTP